MALLISPNHMGTATSQLLRVFFHMHPTWHGTLGFLCCYHFESGERSGVAGGAQARWLLAITFQAREG